MKRAIFACLIAVGSVAGATVKDGVTKWQAGDDKGAVAEWLPYAARGDTDAMFNLGQAYKLGRGVVLNARVAQEYFRRAADRGHAPAQERLGLSLFSDTATRAEALKLLDQAARADQPRALYVVAVALFNGEGMTRDWPRAYGYMTRASAKGVAQASTALQTMAASIPMSDRVKGEEVAAALAKVEFPSVPVTTPERSAATISVPDRPRASPAQVAVSTQGWRVQLGAFKHRELANDAWTKLKRAAPSVLADADAVFQPAGDFVRLQIGPYPSRDAAKSTCSKLAAAGTACFVVAG